MGEQGNIKKNEKMEKVINSSKIYKKTQYLGHGKRVKYNFANRNTFKDAWQNKKKKEDKSPRWIRQWYNDSSIDLFATLTTKIKITMMIANFLKANGVQRKRTVNKTLGWGISSCTASTSILFSWPGLFMVYSINHFVPWNLLLEKNDT